MAPPVTVFMPVYNGAPHLEAAIQSILLQTFSDFDFLIIDDGSTDQTRAIIQSFHDPRIKFVSRANCGLIATLNEGISLINTQYIARMDADDISSPERLKLQFEYMEKNPHIGVCGTDITLFGNARGRVYFGRQDNDIKNEMIFHCPIAHPTVMIRRRLFDFFTYSTKSLHCEDYRLWLDLSQITNFHNLNKSLLMYRIHQQQVSHKNLIQRDNAAKIGLEAARLFGIDFSPQEAGFHTALINKTMTDFSGAESYLERLEKIPNLPYMFIPHWYEFCKINGASQAFTQARKILPLKYIIPHSIYDLRLRLRMLIKGDGK